MTFDIPYTCTRRLVNQIVSLFLFHAGAIAVKGGHYGAGVGVILLDNVACSGSEQNLLQCSHRGVGVVSTCDHSKDVGVICRKQGKQRYDNPLHFMPFTGQPA